MKRLILHILIIFSTIGLNAQSLLPIKYGLKAGLNIANIASTPSEGVKNLESSSKIAISGGFYMEIPLTDKWYINPELVYSQKGASFEYDYIQDYNINNRQKYSTTNNLSISYIELNPNISYRASHKVSLNLGPSISFLMSPNYSYAQDPTNQNSLSDGELNEETLDVGLNCGLSYYINDHLLIESKVYSGFLKMGEVSRPIDLKKDEASHTIKNSAFVFSFAYLF